MTVFDIDKVLEPVSEDSPCGDDLEYDAEFGELERAAQGKPGHEMGDKVIPPEPPVWTEVAEAATALLGRTKDLRVAVRLAQSSLNLEGIQGLASGLDLINRLLHDYWDGLHPNLDEEDDNDPTLRVNSLLPLNSREEFVDNVSRAILVSSKTLGRFSLRDIRLASGDLKLPESDDSEIPDPSHIDAAFLDCELEELTQNSESISQCIDTLKDLETYTGEQVGSEFAPDVGALRAELNAIQKILAERLGLRGIAVESAEGEAESESVAQSSPGTINSRDDAIRVLDRVSEYFRNNEPSSPVPLLLQRAKRLIAKDFMEILRDMAPQGLKDVEKISGLDRDE